MKDEDFVRIRVSCSVILSYLPYLCLALAQWHIGRVKVDLDHSKVILSEIIININGCAQSKYNITLLVLVASGETHNHGRPAILHG